jgi:orotate phosphoribosyltransferase
MSKKSDKTDKINFSQILWRTGAIKFGTFTLTSGKLSPYYIDLRVIPSFPEALQKIIQIYVKEAEELGLEKFKIVAGIPTAGMVYASILAYAIKKPFIYIRKEAKEWGRERRIEGVLKPGDPVLIVDDLITTGKSVIDAAKAIRAEGGTVANAIVLIDREEKGTENAAKEGIKLRSFMKIREIAKMLYDLQEITKDRYRAIIEQIKK